MRTRMVLWLICLAAVGCGGQFDPGATADDEAALGKIIKFGAYPDVSWQFFYCLDSDHREGLKAAMLDLSLRPRYVSALPAAMAGAIADSQCVEGQERGGLFRGNPGSAARALGLQFFNIRPDLSAHAFSVTRGLILDIAAKQYALLPARFDAQGAPAASGRFALNGYSVGTNNDVDVTVLDTATGKTVTISTHGPALPDGGERIVCQTSASVYPWRDDNPLVQTVINAANAFINRYEWSEMLGWGPTCGAIEALQLYAAPSLSGWPMPLEDEIFTDGPSKRYVVYGGHLIR